jgi:beta-phosphoglucomutase-like phosphatase (HAD superfamily)
VYEHAANELGVDPEACVAVEDSVHGMTSASRAGMHVVGFRHGEDHDIDRSNTDATSETPEEVRDHLLSITA